MKRKLYLGSLATSVAFVLAVSEGNAGMSAHSSRTSVPAAVEAALADMGIDDQVIATRAQRTENFTRMNRPVRTFVWLRDEPGHVAFLTSPRGEIIGVYPMMGFDMALLESRR